MRYKIRIKNPVMGVPITFMNVFSPEQFEIVGLTQRGCHDERLEIKKYDDYWEVRQDGSKTGSNGSKTNGNPKKPNLRSQKLVQNSHETEQKIQYIYLNVLETK